MKRCPQCRRDYFDDTLSFCLEDGSPLILGIGSIHSTGSPSSSLDQPTMIHSTAAPDSGSSTAFMPAQAYVPRNENAIAVLPFANMSPTNDTEYLSDGLAEELLNVLSRINGLRVAGRTSSFSFKGKQTTFEEIGRQLHVSSVLEGSVRTAGNRVRISVQLVNVSDGYHLWSQTYDRTLDDIFAIQDDIAASVVEEVRSRLLGTEEDDPSLSRQVKVEIADAVRGRVQDPEAHRLMMLGRHFVFRGSTEDLNQAIDHFERALAIDPQNAQCWVKLGIAHVHRASQGFTGYGDGYEQARRCANQALSVSNDFAAGHALLARIHNEFDFDFRGSAESIKRAIELDPEGLDVMLAAGPVMRNLCRLKESAEMYRRVAEHDPLNVSAYRGLANTLSWAGLFDEAEDAVRRAIELWPDSLFVQAQMAIILLGQGRTEEALTAALKEPEGPWRGWARAIVEHAAGRRDEAERVLDEYIGGYSGSGAFQIAEIYSSMGRAEKAFEYLEQGFNTGDAGIGSIVASPLLKPLHTDARWQTLLRKIGIPEEYWPHNA